MKKYLLLITALVIGAFLRLWMLSSVPNGLTWDEAAIGYNAYSLLKTGRDEHGAILPIVFKSFGDFKPGAYIYLTVPSVAIFGLNEFAVRFPSALAGILAIWGIYLLTREIFATFAKEHSNQLASFAALALALSPWHVHFSHGAWEVNVFTTLTIFALYYFLRFVKGKSTLYPTLFFACFSLAMYQAAKLLTPLVYLLFVIPFWKEFWYQLTPYFKPKKILLTSPFILFGLWIFFGSLFGSAGNRLTTLSIFNYKPGISAETKAIDNQNPVTLDLFHNQKELSTRLVLSRYLYHFSPEVLFYEGPIVSERGHLPGLGVLNPLEFIWLVIGFIWLVKSLSPGSHDTPDRSTALVLGLLLVAPIPASLTLAEFSTVRALFMAVPLAMISGVGIYYLYTNSKIFFSLFAGVYILCTIYVFDNYFFHSQTVFAKEFNYGYKQVIQIIKENPTKRVVFTDVYGQPYIYYVFYTAYDPATYQKNNEFISGGLDVGRVDHVGNVEFHQFGSSDMMTQPDTLFIGSEGNINNQFDIAGPKVDLFRQIETPDHHILFRVIKTKP
ncbi:hypothetical protein A3K29_02930 [Candidatus Collierbacteria bacterium RIFOXYB2_FULL_46_14]|uniref:Glycosyltransferase RgtA/B/C/D-like domain-containing protein n=1 Tax=Candidatus Collierbacteria bacterium GW2011_GWA2_46_26 TaxID=1618381 RepID=A0A0G1PMF0_9BACT|nr:MAG: hypothetical protein UW29_C0004G0092 [Candidatus Collierbacteria bacterium GW2011_GWC2_44_13]KKU33857.1 MAG: hypothetical protein UX47_C0001G0140 [Candidatus Collierbacteria bacterium GW2011_GWA2_46_26]OGD73074.1 MAG: hypothetical protein A3K29_02930 [Candidatus Collierbacteria bacterium RIFOXYB2_FULL_46_14]OGD76116.1 MAG: hypothetical protein A3K43_02930 [Candidatus Collierbacteria bacterium RIFOXYA2_FULL_46_20]OGD77452.1 MAG: hypothetical protein A3K39_02930 [Candidatus Collierbacteri